MLLAAVSAAHAAVAVLVEQPYGRFGLFNPTGHAAIYLDHVCAETPLELRPCRPGELGVVISRYDGIGTYDWVAIPLLPYLYAVDSADAVPAFVSRETEERLRDTYRREALESVAPDGPDASVPEGNWYELVGAAFDRTIYGFEVDTTPEQDARLIAELNDRKNAERYNGAFVNCADFARTTINRFYPRAVRRNFIADLGLTTPKSVARSLAHYAAKHPDTHLRTFVIPQLPGEMPRSRSTEGVAESLVKKGYAMPIVALSPPVVAGVLAAYVGQGRFSMPRHSPPLLDLGQLRSTAASARTARPASASGVSGTLYLPNELDH